MSNALIIDDRKSVLFEFTKILLRTQKQSLQGFYTRKLSFDDNNCEFLVPNFSKIKPDGTREIKFYFSGAIPLCKELKLE